MKKLITSLTLFLTLIFGKTWVSPNNTEASMPNWDVNVISKQQIEITFELDGYFIEELRDGKKRITFPSGVPLMIEGAPEVPVIAKSIVVPNLAHMEVHIIGTDFTDYNLDDIVPSKGNLTRNIDPKTVPYIFGKPFFEDQFFPKDIVYLRDPYIMRSLRGQAVVFQPIQYNPIRKILRVFSSIRIEVKENGTSDINPLTRFPKNVASSEYEQIYQDHFLNYTNTDRYEPLSEQGPMLIISYGDFMDEMQPFVDWKNYKGIPTEIVDIADIGSVTEMEQFIEDAYYENGIAYVLLVGDIAQIETIRRSDGAGANSPSDNTLSFTAGNDAYPDLFIGRFSAENGDHVTTMVDRTIEYEMEPDPSSDWYKKGSGFASDQGPGDDGEYDTEHLNNIREILLDYTYNHIDQVYDPTGTVAEGEAAINEGRSIINYTGHGSNSSWGNGCPMNNTDVNGLTNVGRYPFIWSVACVNGEFHLGTCFAETWLRATNADDGTPTGAVVTLMSTVNQGWNPPMDGQDEMNLILVESYENNIKRTFGGLSINGMMQMNDNYGSAGYDEVYYWTCFGDPSLVVRTDTPTEMTINYDEILIIGATSFSIETGESGALVAISRDGNLIGSNYTDASGALTIEFDEPIEVPGEINIVVTSYNKIPFENTINVIAPDGAYMLLGDAIVSGGTDDILDFGEDGYLYTTFENVGQESSDDLFIALSHPGNMVTINTTEIEQSSVASGELVTVGPFDFEVDWNLEDGEQIPFVLDISSGNDTWSYNLTFPVEAPAYTVLSAQFVDGGNGVLDPGESITLYLTLLNSGNASIESPTFDVTTSDPYITLGNINSDNESSFDINSEITLEIQVSASADVPIGHTATIGIIVGAIGTDYAFSVAIPITLGLLIEDFETGTFAEFDWIHSGDAQWEIHTDAYSGNYSVQSGSISNNQISELSLIMNILYEGDLTFFAKASSEQGNSGIVYDYLEFYIDDQEQNLVIGGESSWDEYTVTLPVGEHNLKWVYKKDAAQSSGDDCAWVDRIQFPPGAITPLSIDFGDLNLDGVINVLDVIVTVNTVMGYLDLSNDQLQNADMNLDGVINVIDILMIVDVVLSE